MCLCASLGVSVFFSSADSAAEGRDARDMVCFDVDAQCAWRSHAVALNERVGATKMALSPPMPQGPMEEKFQHEYRSTCLHCSKHGVSLRIL